MDQLSNIFSAVLTETFGLESMTLAVMQIPIFRCCVPSTFSDVCFIFGLLLCSLYRDLSLCYVCLAIWYMTL